MNTTTVMTRNSNYSKRGQDNHRIKRRKLPEPDQKPKELLENVGADITLETTKRVIKVILPCKIPS